MVRLLSLGQRLIEVGFLGGKSATSLSVSMPFHTIPFGLCALSNPKSMFRQASDSPDHSTRDIGSVSGSHSRRLLGDSPSRSHLEDTHEPAIFNQLLWSPM
jgi:hypothetical protein